MHGIRDFAIDSPQDVVSHAINHEIGHMVFNRATLENKGEIFEQFKNDVILSTGEKKYFDSVNSEIASIYDELLIEFGL